MFFQTGIVYFNQLLNNESVIPGLNRHHFFCRLFFKLQTKMQITALGCHPAARGTLQEALLD